MKRFANLLAIVILTLSVMSLVGGDWKIPDIIPKPMPVNPLAVDGFRVLIVYESGDLSMPPAQSAAIWSGKVFQYLTEKCPKGETGTPDYRILDTETDMRYDSVWWRDAMKRDRKSLPWIVIGSYKGGYEGPCPANEAEMLTLLRQHGG